MKQAKTSIFSILFLFISFFTANAQMVGIELKKGLVIKSNAKIKKGIYKLNAGDSINQPLVLIEGNNITVDFTNALMQGSNDRQLPNEFYGLAIRVKGNNITIRNARVSGYKIALMAEGCNNLVIENSDFSYNWRQQMQSTRLGEDLSDWMSFHHNEKDEWLRWGAGIYLKDCNKFIIRNNTITGGQCALMMTRSNEGLIHGNDFSFNSALGIGMYRSSRNNILNNKLDFNVRGYSHGFFNRGQDSAGLLIFEQCNENVIAYNSITHGGDGIFLWAGQTTMDSSKGGCNDNYIIKNDCSYAPTNGIEVTFSKNRIEENIIKECDHGIWGGYSWNTVIANNLFEKNRIGVAIEHGQNNSISYNKFKNNKVDGIRLWARKIQPSDWGYANKRDTRSMRYEITGNEFNGEQTAINITMTDDLIVSENSFTETKKSLKTDSTVTNLVSISRQSDTASDIPDIISTWKQNAIPLTPFPKGKHQMRITEWGPYDFRYPLAWLTKIDSNGTHHFELLGPAGNWELKKMVGLKNISVSKGSIPATITVEKIKGAPDVQLNLIYKGKAFTDVFGKQQRAGLPHSFSFRDYQPDINWNVNWYGWDKAHDPNKDYAAFKTHLENSTALKNEVSKKLNYTWWGEIGKKLPADSFATIATGTVEVANGWYDLGITADDLVKVFVDEKLVIDFWDASKYKNDEDSYHHLKIKLGGKHSLRVEHVENSGYATLIFRLKPLGKVNKQ